MRYLVPALMMSGLLALSACSEEAAEPDEAAAAEAVRSSDTQPPAPANNASGDDAADDIEAAAEDGTPMEERVATIGLLNKRNNVSIDLEMRPGETREEGPVIVTLAACERTAPWEMPQETGAFVQVEVLERGQSSHTRVFSGWLFKRSPSLNVVEHPIYDVWVKDCTMRFPGDDA